MNRNPSPAYEDSPTRNDGWFWPTLHLVDTTMTPRQAWRAWLLGEIDAAEFGAVLNAWHEVTA